MRLLSVVIMLALAIPAFAQPSGSPFAEIEKLRA